MTIAKQVKTYGPLEYTTESGAKFRITAHVRHDDSCHNGHNSFAITANIDSLSGSRWVECAGGQLHDEIRIHFPSLAPHIKWHLTSTDGPMHYVANTLYWLGYSGWCDGKPNSPPNLEHARMCAVWPDMPETLLSTQNGNDGGKTNVTLRLHERLPALMEEFKRDVLSLGLEY